MSSDAKRRCEPIKTYEDVLKYMDDPPDWAEFCVAYTTPSKNVVKNHITTDDPFEDMFFCHVDPDEEDLDIHDRYLLPRTLVCHDMANGYHDDSYIDGTTNYDAYNFYNWSGIDIFCYFSHHFVTVPPLGWINAAHKHGVRVIGTLITEWRDGADLWKKILASKSEWQRFADILVSICKHFKFEGWLLNVENELNSPRTMVEFVTYFHRKLHEEVHGAFLIWYDSVTIDGALKWQNGLTDLNFDYFMACDGIFTNYSWTEKDIRDSSIKAGPRRHSVFIGIDVWGRNFHGGGEFNTFQAIQLGHKYNCSLAIFGQAWTHEATDSTKEITEIHDDKETLRTAPLLEHFLLRDKAFWDSIWLYLNTRVVSQIPFHTSFCRGQGIKKRAFGKVISSEPWFNLNLMQFQPTSIHGIHGYRLVIGPTLTKKKDNGIDSDKDALPGVDPDKDPLPKDDDTYPAESSNEPKSRAKRFKIDWLDDKWQKLFSYTENETENLDEILDEEKLRHAAKKDLEELTFASQTYIQKVNYRRGEVVGYILKIIPNEKQCLEYYGDDCYNGGSCILINPNDLNNSSELIDARISRLFQCYILCENKMIIYTVTKRFKEASRQFLNVVVSLKRNITMEKLTVTLSGREFEVEKTEDNVEDEDAVVSPLNHLSPEMKELQDYVVKNHPSFYIPLENSYGWEVRYYVLHYPDCMVTSINCQAGRPEGGILLGQFGVCPWTI